jgi:hypothetical protein
MVTSSLGGVGLLLAELTPFRLAVLLAHDPLVSTW